MPLARQAAHITRTLLLAQSLGSAGFLVASTVNPLVGAQLGGGVSWAGTPTAAYLAGGALVAFLWGLAMDRIGRRRTLALGLAVGVIGAALAALAVATQRLWPFLAGVSCMGMANSALQLGRFVAAEVSPPARRGRAISTVVLGGTVGAVLGPLLVGPAASGARRLGVDELAGPYATSGLLFAMVVWLLWFWLHPEPKDLAHALGLRSPAAPGDSEARPLRQILVTPRARLALVTLVLAQATMVMLMVITSVHMKDHHHPLPSIASVISSHVFGMYAFSVVAGRLADTWGRRRVIAAGALCLVVASATAPLSPRVLPLAAALFLLGLGWNLCYVSGSALLSDELRPAERASTQGFGDFLIGTAAATGALGSGLVFGAVGYAAMGWLSVVAATIPLLMSLWGGSQREQQIAA